MATSTSWQYREDIENLLISWDLYSDVSDDRNSNIYLESALIRKACVAASFSTGLLRFDEKTRNVIHPLKDRYECVLDYQQHFFPLMLLEAKCHMLRARELMLRSSSSETVTQVDIKCKKNQFFVVYLTRNDNSEPLMHGDLVMLYAPPPPGKHPMTIEAFREQDSEAAVALYADANLEALLSASAESEANDAPASAAQPMYADNPHHCLGVVEGTNLGVTRVRVIVKEDPAALSELLDVQIESASALRTYRATVSFLYQREKYRANWIAARAAQVANVSWNLTRVMNLSTIYREYSALMKLDSYSLTPLLLGSAPPPEATRYAPPPTLLRALEAQYNASQLAALTESLKHTGVSCIQGPPGTGKTRTIIALISLLLCSTKVETQADAALTQSGSVQRSAASESRSANTWTQVQRCWLDEGRFGNEDVLGQPWDEAQDEEQVSAAEVLALSCSELPVYACKLLVCAPSNAAVDEIMRRLVRPPAEGGGVYDKRGALCAANVLRLGPGFHNDLRPWTLASALASQNLDRDGATLLQNSLIERANIICCTLSIAGSSALVNSGAEFDVVIIDEASQGVELSTLIPLRSKCKSMVLVGDPRQLPPTVLSRLVLQMRYNVSLFQRLESLQYRMCLLATQYRMHPVISRFSSEEFYGGSLTDDPGVEATLPQLLPACARVPLFDPLVFLDLDSQEAEEQNSKVNLAEANVCAELYSVIARLLAGTGAVARAKQKRVAIISSYASQTQLLHSLVNGVRRADEPPDLDVNTVDGFQGREKDYVIFSAVRAQFEGGAAADVRSDIGFLSDRRRLNVAITRAKANLWVVGNARYLRRNPLWDRFIAYCERAGTVLRLQVDARGKAQSVRALLAGQLQEDERARAWWAEHQAALLGELGVDGGARA